MARVIYFNGVDPDFRPATKAHVALSVDRLDDLRSRLELAGYATLSDSDIGGRRRFFTSDPFGNRIEFLEKAPKA